MLSKGTKVLESREIKRSMCSVREGEPTKDILVQITKYDGNEEEPRWMDVETNRCETLCHVVADISAAPYTSKVGRFGRTCFTRNLDVVLLVGLTELKAQIRWIDSMTGEVKSGPAAVVYNDSSENSWGPNVVLPPRYGDIEF